MCSIVVTVAREHQVFSIRGKYRKGIESWIEGDLLQACTVGPDHPQVKMISFGFVVA